MLVNSKKILEDAEKRKYAVPQFNVNHLEFAKYVLEECEANKSPVILGISESGKNYIGSFKIVVNLIKNLIEELNITVPVCLHLDHAKDHELCKDAINAGFTSVMIDKSKESLIDNIKYTKEVVEYAKNFDVSVEGELGAIGGNNIEVRYTTKEESLEYVKTTGINSFAPALGTAHGIYTGEPLINFETMDEISKTVNIPLVLHGGSGLSDDIIGRAIEHGTSKINIDTEIRIAWKDAVKEFILNNPDEYDTRKIISSGEKAIKTIVRDKIKLFGSSNK